MEPTIGVESVVRRFEISAVNVIEPTLCLRHPQSLACAHGVRYGRLIKAIL